MLLFPQGSSWIGSSDCTDSHESRSVSYPAPVCQTGAFPFPARCCFEGHDSNIAKWPAATEANAPDRRHYRTEVEFALCPGRRASRSPPLRHKRQQHPPNALKPVLICFQRVPEPKSSPTTGCTWTSSRSMPRPPSPHAERLGAAPTRSSERNPDGSGYTMLRDPEGIEVFASSSTRPGTGPTPCA